MLDFTVAICTYNGEKRLPDVLEKLQNQIGVEEISWEIIIVDNNSKDSTAEVIKTYQANWSTAYPIKYCFEPKQGLAFARRRAVKEARGNFIGFLDDDNLPASNWVEAAHRFTQLHPKLGAYGGRIGGEFEVDPPEGFEKIARFFALIDGKKAYCYNHKYNSTRKKLFPPGAGMVIRKEAWLESVPECPRLEGVCGESFSSKGEDIETLSHIQRAGWEIWFNPEMYIEHKIPSHRLEKKYLISFFRGVGISRYQIRMLSYKPWQRPLIIPAYLANDLLKTVLYFIKSRKKLKEDIVTACEMELLLGLVSSPFYHWKKQLMGV